MTFPKCVATNCRKRGRFRFPKNEEQRRLWIQALGRKDFKPSNYSVLCEAHFLPEDIIHVNKYGIELLRIQLRDSAVPQIFKTDDVEDDEVEDEDDDENEFTSGDVEDAEDDDEGNYLRPEHLLKIEIQEEDVDYVLDSSSYYRQGMATAFLPPPEVVVRTRRPYPYTCDICQKRFRNTLMLDRHKERHSPTAMKIKKDESKCEFCQKNFCNKYYLKQHLSIHRRKMKVHGSDEGGEEGGNNFATSAKS